MAVKAVKEYTAVPRDRVENFGGKQLVYVAWDHHLLFAAPFLLCLPPETPFRELVDGPLSMLMSPDPDAEKVDWSAVTWLRANEPFTPDWDKTLAENGIRHKDQLRMQTPGLSTLVPPA